MIRHRYLALFVIAACFQTALGGPVTAPSEPIVTAPVASEPPTVFGTTLFDEWKAEKDELGIPLTFGAWHWWRFGSGGPGTDGYGIPGLRGTYYWSIDFDPKLELEHSVFREIGFHTQVRLRDDGPFREFMNDEVWPWEAYAYAKTPAGTFKAGQIWKRFGLDWDGVFYGNVAYFDGYKLDPDLGLAWEHTFKRGDAFKIDAFAQFFAREDGINGTIVGADAESSAGFREESTGVVRVVPTWTFGGGATIALGLSASLGRIESQDDSSDDDTFAAWAVDLTFTKGNFRAFGEVLQSYGRINPDRYVSLGPSDRITDYLVGAHYKTGPITWRASYSAGFDEDPDGEQSLFLPGATIALTPNVDLYLEYVKWVVDPDNAPKSDYEDGYQVILNWRF